ncbi:MAG: hypothetical protein ACTHNU_00770 [Gaiellales bacterium]
MSKGSRVSAVVVGTLIGVLLIAYYITTYVANKPPEVQAATVNGQTQLTLQTVASYGHAPHPDWVSYLVKDPQGKWVHSTIFNLPAHSLVHVTILNYDGDSSLRNPFWAKPRGVIGYAVNGKRRSRIYYPDTSHTFAVPDLGISVPITGVSDAAPNQCSVTPCSLAESHRTITFSFRTGNPGHYRWQCFVPCAAGFLNGFGGPMQSVGWMDGYLNVS